MKSCSGSASESARSTVRPPTPESNTPMGASRRIAADVVIGSEDPGTGLLQLRPHVREQENVANRWRVGKQHHDAVDAESQPGGGRQAALERAHVAGVVIP